MTQSRTVTRPIRSHFFNPVWLYSAGGLLVVGMIIGQPAISLLASAVFVTAGTTWLWTRHSLDGLVYSRRLSENRAFRGEILTMTFQLENRSWLPLAWVEIDEHISDRVRPLETQALPSDRVATTAVRHATPLRWKQRVTWSVDLQCQERGAHMAGPTSIRSGDPFGFFTRQMNIEDRTSFLVYPEVVSLPESDFPPDYPFGSQRVRTHLLTDPIRLIGVRPYAPDDSTRYIHWKASARLQEPQVKIFEPTIALQAGLFLSLDTFERYWEGMDSVRAESAIIAAASLASALLESRYTVGLYVNAVITGSDQTLRIPPGRGPRQLETILEGLARLSPMSSTNFPRMLTSEARSLPAGSTVAIIACLMTEPLEVAILSLLDDGHRVVLVRVGDIAVPDTPKLHVYTVGEQLSEHRDGARHRYARLVRAGALAHDI